MNRTSDPLRRPLQAALVALGLLVAWEALGWDMLLSQRFGTPAGFAWRHLWWTEQLLHNGGRLVSGLFLALLAWDAFRPLAAGPSQRERLYWLVVCALSMTAVPALKRFSHTSCPWDLAEFGGKVPYVPHWLLSVSDGGAGHCFPSGHAVAAFAFIGLYFLWRPYRPRGARIFLVGLVAFGLVFGMVQLVRGAHFASHTLWSAWLCWALALLAARLEPAAYRLEYVQTRPLVDFEPAVVPVTVRQDDREQRR